MKYLETYKIFEGKKKKKRKIDKDQIDPRDKFDLTMVGNVNPDSPTQMNPMNKDFPYHI
jgi:hypothetical protein